MIRDSGVVVGKQAVNASSAHLLHLLPLKDQICEFHMQRRSKRARIIAAACGAVVVDCAVIITKIIQLFNRYAVMCAYVISFTLKKLKRGI